VRAVPARSSFERKRKSTFFLNLSCMWTCCGPGRPALRWQSAKWGRVRGTNIPAQQFLND
jgi:hypothetical protein